MQTSEQKIRVWRLRAEEYRTAGDNCKYDDTKQVYLTLARNYDHLADREERHLTNAARDSSKDSA
jgi:hypothetical protein